MSKHTPGPWIYQRGQSPSKEFKEGHTRFWVETHDGIHAICGIHPLETASAKFAIEQHEANARLIAAAPLMYEALKEIVNNAVKNYEGSMEICQEAIVAARAALQAAKGGDGGK